MNDDLGQGPNVEAALSMSPTTAQLTAESHKPTIGTRKQAPAKKGVMRSKQLFKTVIVVKCTSSRFTI